MAWLHKGIALQGAMAPKIASPARWWHILTVERVVEPHQAWCSTNVMIGSVPDPRRGLHWTHPALVLPERTVEIVKAAHHQTILHSKLHHYNTHSAIAARKLHVNGTTPTFTKSIFLLDEIINLRPGSTTKFSKETPIKIQRGSTFLLKAWKCFKRKKCSTFIFH